MTTPVLQIEALEVVTALKRDIKQPLKINVCCFELKAEHYFSIFYHYLQHKQDPKY